MKLSFSGSTKMTRLSSADWHRKWTSWPKMLPLYRIPATPSSERRLRRENSDRFALPPRTSFRHLYFSFDRPSAHDRAVAALGNIAGKPTDAPEVAAVADPFMFQDYYAERAPEQDC